MSKIIRLTLFLAAVISLPFLFLLLSLSGYRFYENGVFGYFLTGRAVVAILLALVLIWLFFKLIFQRNYHEAVKAVLLSLLSITVFLLVIETAVSFIPVSFTGPALNTLTWFTYYWHPINQYGFRDDDIKEPNDSFESRIAILGDSFTAGHGIKSYRERYSNILQEKLSEQYRVSNLAKKGWATVDEFRSLKELGPDLKPEHVIMQFYLNDMQDMGDEAGLSFDYGGILQHSLMVKTVLFGSYTGNYIFWKSKSGIVYDSYIQYIEKLFYDPAMLSKQAQKIREVADYCEKKNIRFTVLFFPDMVYLDKSETLNKMLSAELGKSGIEAIHIKPYLEKLTVQERVVSERDTHPSEEVHKIVAEILYSHLLKTSI